MEVRCAPTDDLAQDRARAERLIADIEAALTHW
jgi:hypothetical protein